MTRAEAALDTTNNGWPQSSDGDVRTMGESGPGARGPLHGVRVLDLTTVIMGPSATQIIGDLDADVIKVESADGDSMRRIGPFRNDRMGPMYLQGNRNKRSVVLDLKSPEGQAALQALIRDADVLVTNVRPQALARLGLDYAGVSALNPRIIYCAAVGYGSGGPSVGQAVYDDLTQAGSGIAGLFQAIDGAPRYAPVNICDRVVGLYVVIAITSALHHMRVTGEGQEIEVPMLETMAQFVLGDHMGGRAFVPPLGPPGYKRLLSRTRGPYPTKDGYIAVVVYTDKHWRTFLKMVGKPDLMDTDARFKNQETRTQHAEDMGRFLIEHMPLKTTREWLADLKAADIPAYVVNSLDDLFDDPHLNAVGMFEEREHPTEGRLKVARFPVKFSKSPASIRRLAPRLGEHTAEILARITPSLGGEVAAKCGGKARG
jgi:crotonobetainyl-CoA:carnitine CoA-transferase CaiB-like acyl-CoA transferase